MRALVVDDNDGFRTLVVALLADVAEVVEQAADGDVALQLAYHLRPDLIVMDITMPHMDGISAARAILQVHPSARIVFLSGTETAKKLSEASAYGVVIEKNVTALNSAQPLPSPKSESHTSCSVTTQQAGVSRFHQKATPVAVPPNCDGGPARCDAVQTEPEVVARWLRDSARWLRRHPWKHPRRNRQRRRLRYANPINAASKSDTPRVSGDRSGAPAKARPQPEPTPKNG